MKKPVKSDKENREGVVGLLGYWVIGANKLFFKKTYLVNIYSTELLLQY
jgi:hypothetical protein